MQAKHRQQCRCQRLGCPLPVQITQANSFSVERHITPGSLTVHRGDQGTPEWHLLRVGKVTASVAKTYHSARSPAVKLKAAKRSCRVLEVQKELRSPAVVWGRQHESTAAACYLKALQEGVQVTEYTGPLEPSDKQFWKKGSSKWTDHLATVQLPPCQLVALDRQVQLLCRPDIAHLAASPDAVVFNPMEKQLYCLEIKCPQEQSWGQSAAEYLLGGRKWTYIMQLLQQRAVLGDNSADFVDFVVWQPNQDSAPSISNPGKVDILRVHCKTENYVQVMFGPIHCLAVHYIYPIQQWVSNQPAFPGVTTAGEQLSRVLRFAANTEPRIKVCKCGSDRLCLRPECNDTCSCSCLLKCGQPFTQGHDCDGCIQHFLSMAGASLDLRSLPQPGNDASSNQRSSGGSTTRAARGRQRHSRTNCARRWVHVCMCNGRQQQVAHWRKPGTVEALRGVRNFHGTHSAPMCVRHSQ